MPWRGLLRKWKKWLLLAVNLITPHWRLPNGIGKIVKSMPCKRGENVRLDTSKLLPHTRWKHLKVVRLSRKI